MQSFRCYFLDDRDRIADATMVEALDLADAVRRCRALLNGDDRRGRFHGIEIWQGVIRLYTDESLAEPALLVPS
ncbi:MAG: hypothetical protein BGO51_28285 [Rhodospirillales bacterium 69-11]|nr:hypothetical protein [Rhodospirillales bacterium]MBN8925769.1 hypothetical protein [Rhodospirillales bacterium]OJW25206.1 MAG: hypothetical protein BGO51_28285 [Rhodospirillales bacterium 69-11]